MNYTRFIYRNGLEVSTTRWFQKKITYHSLGKFDHHYQNKIQLRDHLKVYNVISDFARLSKYYISC